MIPIPMHTENKSTQIDKENAERLPWRCTRDDTHEPFKTKRQRRRCESRRHKRGLSALLLVFTLLVYHFGCSFLATS